MNGNYLFMIKIFSQQLTNPNIQFLLTSIDNNKTGNGIRLNSNSFKEEGSNFTPTIIKNIGMKSSLY
jgi:hypothetical protein